MVCMPREWAESPPRDGRASACLAEVWMVVGCVMRSTCTEIGGTTSRTSAYLRLCGILRAGIGCLVPVPGATPSDRPCPRTLRRLSCAAASPVCVDERQGVRPPGRAQDFFAAPPWEHNRADASRVRRRRRPRRVQAPWHVAPHQNQQNHTSASRTRQSVMP